MDEPSRFCGENITTEQMKAGRDASDVENKKNVTVILPFAFLVYSVLSQFNVFYVLRDSRPFIFVSFSSISKISSILRLNFEI